MRMQTLFSLAAFGLLPWTALGHGDVHGQIVDVTAQIAKDPTNASLLIRRGELYRVNQHWDHAQSDFDRALTLAPGLAVVDFLRGRLYLEADWPHSACAALDRFLAIHTNHVEALVTRARARQKIEDRLAAAMDYTRAIQFAVEPRPELFIERAQVLMAAGTNHFAEALRGLDEGIARLGPLVTLQLYAIDLEIKLGRFDEALRRLDHVAAQSPRKETWLARRGEILTQAGRPEEARAAFQAALSALDKLPQSRRNVPAMMELEKRIKAELQTLNGKQQ
ncbi:MAG TPA: tetratricopeptide repeat protein [Methylomirabilota bacterium]|nr:tetratricopeptide repeat protein [Methylomirabilota bacterium]